MQLILDQFFYKMTFGRVYFDHIYAFGQLRDIDELIIIDDISFFKTN